MRERTSTRTGRRNQYYWYCAWAATARIVMIIATFLTVPAISFSTHGGTSSALRHSILYNPPQYHQRHTHVYREITTIRALASEERTSKDELRTHSDAGHPPPLDRDVQGGAAMLEDTCSDENTKATTGNDDDDDNRNESARIRDLLLSVKAHFLSLKKQLYARITQLLLDLVTLIKRSVKKSEAWVRDDAVGQLVSSALALVVFFAAVAAFAVWNIEVLGGKKWSGPKKVTIPVVRVPDSSTSYSYNNSVKFQQPKWKAPKLQTSYNNNVDETTPNAPR